MSTLRTHLTQAIMHLQHQRIPLERASHLAAARGYDSTWSDAINVALANNQKAMLHIENLATLLDLTAPLRRSRHHKPKPDPLDAAILLVTQAKRLLASRLSRLDHPQIYQGLDYALQTVAGLQAAPTLRRQPLPPKDAHHES